MHPLCKPLSYILVKNQHYNIFGFNFPEILDVFQKINPYYVIQKISALFMILKVE